MIGNSRKNLFGGWAEMVRSLAIGVAKLLGTKVQEPKHALFQRPIYLHI